ncbi:MAG: (d)CMP kinase [Candidatus Cloacimonas sp.]|nr:(d)CMP kinase [Candidatus Cloacimonadota bacterium]
MGNYIIAIDGPAASGKSTTAKGLAKLLNYTYIDTGAMFRAVALAILEENIDYQNEENLNELLNSINIEFRLIKEVQNIFLNGVNVSDKIRLPEVTKLSSIIATYPAVRSKLLELQREFGKNGRIIMDGRDIGTVIFPNADFKFFLTGSTRIRAERRWKELNDPNVSLEEIEEDLIWRDKNDSSRSIAPLQKAVDAYEVDTNDMSVEEQVNYLYRIIEDKR